MQLSSRAQVRDLKLHHEAVQEELTYTKNHLHHVEVRRVQSCLRAAACNPCSCASVPTPPDTDMYVCIKACCSSAL